MNLVLKLQVTFIVPEETYLDIRPGHKAFRVRVEQQQGCTGRAFGLGIYQPQIVQQVFGCIFQHIFIHTSASRRFLAETV